MREKEREREREREREITQKVKKQAKQLAKRETEKMPQEHLEQLIVETTSGHQGTGRHLSKKLR